MLLSTFYIVNTYNKFNLISIGSNIDKVKKVGENHIFRALLKGKYIYTIDRCLFINVFLFLMRMIVF